MRRVLLSLAGLVFVSDAFAADYLRGSTYEPAPARYNWAGVYAGGQIGYAESNVNPGGAVSPLIANLLRRTTIEAEGQVSQWPQLPNGDARAMSYGGFIGYNSQWGDVVIGAEGNYSHTSLATNSTDSIARRFTTSSGVRYDTTVDSAASMRITDYGTLRMRAGYAWNWMMPYLAAGLAVGRADMARSVTITSFLTDMTTAPPTPLGTIVDVANENVAGAFTFGYTAGFGIDIGLMPGVFIRGEYEFIQLNTLKGQTATINTFRTAAAVKF